MAYGTNVGLDTTLPTITDLSAKQFYFVTVSSAGNVAVSGAGDLSVGVVQDGPVGTASVPRATSVRYGGITKVVCGGTFAIGDKVSSDASGKCVKYTAASVYTGTPYTVSGTQVLGVALEAGASGQNSTIIFSPSGLSA